MDDVWLIYVEFGGLLAADIIYYVLGYCIFYFLLVLHLLLFMMMFSLCSFFYDGLCYFKAWIADGNIALHLQRLLRETLQGDCIISGLSQKEIRDSFLFYSIIVFLYYIFI